MRKDIESRKPTDKNYLECNLPLFLQRSIADFTNAIEQHKQGFKLTFWDCYYCELQSDINSAEVNGTITSEQAWYLREKYLGLGRNDNYGGNI